MITVKKEFEVPVSYDLEKIAPPDRLLFFDIETTGLSAWNSCLYLIGAVTVEDGHFVLRQWFSQSLSEEQTVLKSFFDFSRQYEVLISFNGETFDIRYLQDTAKQYGLPCPLTSLQSFDILKHLRKKKSLLNLPNFRQKTVEKFLGIDREDRYTGGELIKIYEDYTLSHDKEAERFLLLHNEEDIKGMPKILPALSYSDALCSDFSITESWRSKDGGTLFLTAEFPCCFPCPLDLDFSEDIRLHFTENRIECRIRLLDSELKYFYPDYKNYYFLTVEGYAIHKKLAAFVDKKYRVPATAATCYTKMSGTFVPALKNSGLPLFLPDYKSPAGFHLLQDSPGFLNDYLRALLALI